MQSHALMTHTSLLVFPCYACTLGRFSLACPCCSFWGERMLTVASCPHSDYIYLGKDPDTFPRHVIIRRNHIVCNSRSIYVPRDWSCNVVIDLGHTFKTGRCSLWLNYDWITTIAERRYWVVFSPYILPMFHDWKHIASHQPIFKENDHDLENSNVAIRRGS